MKKAKDTKYAYRNTKSSKIAGIKRTSADVAADRLRQKCLETLEANRDEWMDRILKATKDKNHEDILQVYTEVASIFVVHGVRTNVSTAIESAVAEHLTKKKTESLHNDIDILTSIISDDLNDELN